jgi:hypothetical protein
MSMTNSLVGQLIVGEVDEREGEGAEEKVGEGADEDGMEEGREDTVVSAGVSMSSSMTMHLSVSMRRRGR